MITVLPTSKFISCNVINTEIKVDFLCRAEGDAPPIPWRTGRYRQVGHCRL